MSEGILRRPTLLLLAVLLVWWLVSLSLFVVDERRQAVVLEFGKPVREITEPGLYFKTPFVQEVRKLPRTLQLWGGLRDNVLPDLPTRDGKKVEVIPWALWRIAEPTKFVSVLVTEERARQRVGDVVRGAARDVITQYDLAELVRSTDRKLTFSFRLDISSPAAAPAQIVPPAAEESKKVLVGREKIVAEIKRKAMQDLAGEEGVGRQTGRGLELIDVGIAEIDFVPQVREAAFDRIIAMMQASASFYTNEGERERQEILNSTNAEMQRIEGEGKEESNRLRGAVDAEIISSYAKAITQAGEFYTFVRTLEAYKKALGKDTRLILTTDSEFFRLLKDIGTAEGATPPARSAPGDRR
jgi:membrane protease subunit HflC